MSLLTFFTEWYALVHEWKAAHARLEASSFRWNVGLWQQKVGRVGRKLPVLVVEEGRVAADRAADGISKGRDRFVEAPKLQSRSVLQMLSTALAPLSSTH